MAVFKGRRPQGAYRNRLPAGSGLIDDPLAWFMQLLAGPRPSGRAARNGYDVKARATSLPPR